MQEKSSISDIKIGCLVVDRNDMTRVGVVCDAAFRIDVGPGAWVLWPGEDYAWTALCDIECVTASIGA
jgi:hypothetical protein